MNETKKETFKEKCKRFTDEYGFVIPAVVVLTMLNTISIACINKTIKIHNKEFNMVAQSMGITDGVIDDMCEDISLLKKIVKEA